METGKVDRLRDRKRFAAAPRPGHAAAHWNDGAGAWRYVPSRCASMHAVEQRALRVAPSAESVLILGETGVGKDLLARLIHENSGRKHRPFVHLNCASLSESLLESELFGHMRGSYTGADESRAGQFEAASGGTFFLDEIGEIPARLQAKLLHVLQEKKIYRIGGRQPLDVDVRVIAATNRDLTKDIHAGIFRRDLFYRLGVVTLRVPPLRDRPEDVQDLATHFLSRYRALYNRPDLAAPAPDLLDRLRGHSWPGNVRELENLIKRVVLMGETDLLSAEMLAADEEERRFEPPQTPEESAPPRSLREAARRAVKKAECHMILDALRRTAWNRKRAARELGVSYRALLYKMKDYTLRPVTAAPSADPSGEI
jgi:two-component system, NtrC family, response regulator AtoC